MQKKILITNRILDLLAGTELVVRDLARGIKANGHIPMIYSPILGTVAEGLIAEGFTVVNDLSLLPVKPDIIHGHHHIQTLQALMHFPDVPAIYVCHDVNYHNDLPPLHDQILTYVAVSYATLQRVVNEARIPWQDTKILSNIVDTNLFKLRTSELPAQPKKALFFSNYTKDWSELSPFQEACQQLGISFDAVGGGLGKLCYNPETILGDYDIVFAVGKCAVEAMAVGCAVIPAYPGTAIGEMVSLRNVRGSRRRNFAQCMRYAAETPRIVAEINKYDPAKVLKVTQFIRKYSSLEYGVENYLKLYDKTIKKWEAKKDTYVSNKAFTKYLDHQLEILNKPRRLIRPIAVPRTLNSGLWRPLELALNMDFRINEIQQTMKRKPWINKYLLAPIKKGLQIFHCYI